MIFYYSSEMEDIERSISKLEEEERSVARDDCAVVIKLIVNRRRYRLMDMFIRLQGPHSKENEEK